MLRFGAVLLLVIGLVILWPRSSTPPVEAAITNLAATINGAQENPPVTTPTTTGGAARPGAFGSASFVLDDVALTMTMNATIFNLDCTGAQTADTNDNLLLAHIHRGAPAVNGPVIWGFFGAPLNDNNPNNFVMTPFVIGVGCNMTGRWDAPEGAGTTLAAEVANILGGNTYINFHSQQFPGGEIRGQILPAAAPGTDLTAVKTSSAANVAVGAPWAWTILLTNGGAAPAVFPAGSVILRDNLPAGPSYGPVATIGSNITNTSAIACSIAANVLTCTATSPVAFNAGGSLNVVFIATSAAAGTFANPRGGGICSVDPDGAIIESTETNNACANTVTVGTTTATPVPTATSVPIPIAPPVIPQQVQNPAAILAVQGGIGNGTRNNTPVPARPQAVAPVIADPGLVIRPPSTGDGGLAAVRLGRVWSAF
jgi:hypothetical protein